jgi:hypothetical protein
MNVDVVCSSKILVLPSGPRDVTNQTTDIEIKMSLVLMHLTRESTVLLCFIVHQYISYYTCYYIPSIFVIIIEH